MRTNLFLGQYVPGVSLIHRLDPRTKLAISAAFAVAIFLIEHTMVLAAIGLTALLICAIARVPLSLLFRGLRPLLYILIFTVIFHGITSADNADQALISAGILKISADGLNQGLFFALRLIILVIGTTMVTLTTPLLVMADGLESLLSPLRRFKIDSHQIALTIVMAFRFIPILSSEADQIIKAQTSRGADFESGRLVSRAKAYLPVLIPLFVSTFRRAQQLAVALEARGYRGSEGRTKLRELRLSMSDARFSSAAVVLFALFVWIDKTILK